MPTVRARDGVMLCYQLHDYTDPFASAPLLILQHGFSRHSGFWYAMVPYLARFFRVCCPDLRGLGQSSTDFDPDEGVSFDNYISDVLTIADSLGVESFHYAGESLGGMIGTKLAARHVDRVKTLTLISTPPFLPETPRENYPRFGYESFPDALRHLGAHGWCKVANNSTRFPPDADPRLVEWYASEGGKAKVEMLIAMSRLLETYDLRPDLPQIEAPVLGLYPTSAPTIQNSQEAALRSGIRDFTLVHIPIRFHMIWALKPAVCARQMLYFIGGYEDMVCQE